MLDFIYFQENGIMAGVIGIGGVFLKFKKPTEMRGWYKDVLGMKTNDYGVLFSFNHSSEKVGYLQLGTFEEDTTYFGVAKQQAMLNLRVSNLEEFKTILQNKTVNIVDEIETYEYVKFLHIEDPEGNRIELWEPVDETFTKGSDEIMPML